jgi:hypothetical protein
MEKFKNNLKKVSKTVAAVGRGIAYGALMPFDMIDGLRHMGRPASNESDLEISADFGSHLTTSTIEVMAPLYLGPIVYLPLYGTMALTNTARYLYSKKVKKEKKLL